MLTVSEKKGTTKGTKGTKEKEEKKEENEKVGLLINFTEEVLRDGIKRLVF